MRATGIPYYILPGPSLIVRDPGRRLGHAVGLALDHAADHLHGAARRAWSVGVALPSCSPSRKWLELALFPYAVILQVTPIVAIAPLIIIWVRQPLSLLICAWIVAFFPILSNTTVGLNSADHNLLNLFQLYGATRWQTLRYLSCRPRCPISWAG